jgi:hypothetical protein
MARSIKELEARLARLEKELVELKATITGKSKIPWYREIVGSFAHDPVHKEIVRLGRLIRRGKIKG